MVQKQAQKRLRGVIARASLAIVLVLLAGCKHRDLVEAELRYVSRRNRQLERELCQRQAEVHTLQSMVVEKPVDPSQPPDTPDTVYRREAISRVSLGMTTGGRDVDRDGRVDAVQYSINCHDYDGDAFKCPGSAEVFLDAILDNGSRATVGNWQIDQEDLRKTWKSSVLGAGYQVIVPLPAGPKAKRWKARVKFTTLDGRVFEDEKEFSMALDEIVPPNEPESQPTPEPRTHSEEPEKLPCIIPTAGNIAPTSGPVVRLLSPVVE